MTPVESPLFQLTDLVRLHLGPISIALRAGECIGIRGPSGSGKSQLFRSIVDLDPHRGSAALRGVVRDEFSPAQWRNRVALLPAEPAWWFDHIGEHLPQWSAELLASLGFQTSMVDRLVTDCSTGERQRLALVRILYQKPAVLLLDEPTASLDKEACRRVEEVVKELCHTQGVGVLWASHDEEQLGRVADRELLLEHGQLRELVK